MLAWTTVVLGLASVFWHAWTPILLELLLRLIEFLLSLLSLLWSVGLLESLTVFANIADIVTQLLAVRAISLMTTAAAATSLVT